MTTVTYIEHDGTAHTVNIENDMTLMEGAQLNMVPSIEGMCGGICSCATCHVYVDPGWEAQLPQASAGEEKMLATAKHRQPNSRLGCQIVVTPALEGLTVHLPPEQGQHDA